MKAATGGRRVTDMSPGSGMHFTDPMPRKWPGNGGKRERCACSQWGLCLAHAAQRDAAARISRPAPKGGAEL